MISGHILFYFIWVKQVEIRETNYIQFLNMWHSSLHSSAHDNDKLSLRFWKKKWFQTKFNLFVNFKTMTYLVQKTWLVKLIFKMSWHQSNKPKHLSTSFRPISFIMIVGELFKNALMKRLRFILKNNYQTTSSGLVKSSIQFIKLYN